MKKLLISVFLLLLIASVSAKIETPLPISFNCNGRTCNVTNIGTLDGLDAADFTLNRVFHFGSLIEMATTEFLDIDVTRSGSETTEVIDLDISSSTSGNQDLISFNANSPGTGSQTLLALSHTSSNSGYTKTLLAEAISTGTGDATALEFDATATGGGDIIGIFGDARDQGGQTASNIWGILLGVSKSVAGSQATGIGIFGGGSLGADRGLWFTGKHGIGIDFNVADITGSVINMLPTQTFSDSTNTYTLTDLNRLTSSLNASDINIALNGGSPTVNQVQEYLDSTGSSGFFSGGEITDGGSGTIDVNAGEGMIRATGSDTARILVFSWSVVNGLAIDVNTTKFVYVEYNSGSPQVVLSSSEFDETPDKIKIGVA